jgi:hypothetical protein
VRIVLAAAGFSRELTTSILWLNSQGVDIRCVRLKPYVFCGNTLLDVQQILPLPEAEDYQIRIREKQQREKATKSGSNSHLRISLELRGKREEGLPARVAIYRVIKYLAESGVSPGEILAAGRFRPFRFRSCDGTLNSEQFIAAASSSRAFDLIRYFCSDEQLIHSEGKTYAFSNQWTGDNVLSKLRILSEAFPNLKIRYWVDEAGAASTDN